MHCNISHLSSHLVSSIQSTICLGTCTSTFVCLFVCMYLCLFVCMFSNDRSGGSVGGRVSEWTRLRARFEVDFHTHCGYMCDLFGGASILGIRGNHNKCMGECMNTSSCIHLCASTGLWWCNLWWSKWVQFHHPCGHLTNFLSNLTIYSYLYIYIWTCLDVCGPAVQ